MRLMMKTLLFAVVTGFLLVSCGGGDPTASNPDVAKLNDEAKAELDKMSNAVCPCLDEHGKDLVAVVDMIEGKMDEIKEDPSKMMAVMAELGDKAQAMDAFGKCMSKAGDDSNEDIMEKAFEEAFPDLKGEEKQMKQMSIVGAYIKKNCKNSEAFDKFLEFGKKMAELR